MQDAAKQVLAANVRRLRIAGQRSLSELARATAISKATLSGIERGEANPTVETLVALAAELRVPVGELLTAPELGPIQVVRAERVPSRAPRRVRAHELERTHLDGETQLAILTLPAAHVHTEPARTPGSRTHLLVLDGTAIAGPDERVTELAAGDYASFPADVPHRIEAIRAPARVLVLAQRAR